MTTRYHVNPETGRPNLCRAKTPETCLYYDAKTSTEAPHFNTKEKARAYVEQEMEKEYEIAKTLNKKTFTPIEIFDKDTLDSYINGDCVYFANEIVEQYPDKYELLLVSDFSDEDVEETFYHAVAAEINGEKLIDAKGVYNNWDDLMKELEEDPYLDLNTEDLSSEEISVDYYLEMGGHPQTYTTSKQTEEDVNKFMKEVNKIV